MNQKKIGKIPVNSRIFIDYSKGEKPNVRYEYPRRDSEKQNQELFFLFFLLFYFILGAALIHSLVNNGERFALPNNCSFTNGYFNTSLNEYITNFSVECNNGLIETFYFAGGTKPYSGVLQDAIRLFQEQRIVGFDKTMNYNSYLAIIELIIMVILYFICVSWSAKIFTKWAVKNKWMKSKIPGINKAIAGRAYYIKFDKVPDNKIIEIPLFKNISMDYNAEGDFSKYLSRFEIKEHPYTKYLFRKSGKKLKPEKNIHLWYARFYFSELPKSGKLEVRFI